MRPRSIDEFLTQSRIPYTTFRHAAAYTAQDEAAVSHIPGRSWAKTVVCFADCEPVIAVVAAPCLVDLAALRAAAGTRTVRLAREGEFRDLYPDCEPGAMPPFGSLYHQRVFVDRSLVGEAEMVFNAGSFTDAIRMHYADFAEIARPIVGAFACWPSTRAVSKETAPVRRVNR